jgi:amino acid transporter
MGLDAFSSASYGPEATLTILVATGVAGLGQIGAITWVIIALLAILSFSYWQTIWADPNNGGSYVAAKDNLGTDMGLLAAAALMIDYLLNVAVDIMSVSAPSRPPFRHSILTRSGSASASWPPSRS